MAGLNKQEPLILLLGDIVIFMVALWLALLLRYGHFPDAELLRNHALAFAPLLVIWLIIFFIAGLYERHTMLLRRRLPNIIFGAQVVNGVVAVAFFYFASYLTISPKTILFLYVVLSSIGAIIWRIYGYPLIGSRDKQNAFLIGQGDELRELEAEVNHNDLYPMRFVSAIDVNKLSGLDLNKDLFERVYTEGVSIIALDTANQKINPLLPHLYNLVFSNVRFINLHRLYEEIFKRVPLSLVRYDWFLENVSNRSKPVFDAIKRIVDIILSFASGLITLPFYPFIALAVKLDDGGPVFFTQERVGKNNRIFKMHKFRSLTAEGKLTRVGKWLRKTRLDELPQLWSVVIGHQSLIGPRPELPKYVEIYNREINFYNVRHLVTPGLSGWAQIYHDNHPHFTPGVSETMEKLSYDLYYINNRSLLLDLEIALKTLRILLTFKGK